MIATRKPYRNTFPTQGETLGWVFWALLCLFALIGLTGEAHAGGFSPAQTTFPSLAVGQTTAPVLVTLTAGSAGTATTPIALTEGVATPALAEFAVSSTGTCGTNPNLAPGQSCTVSATFSPRFPGVRHGAIVLETSGGQLLATTLISGVGQGGLPVLVPGQINTVAGDGQWFYQNGTDGGPATSAPIYLPSGLAVDGAGNLFLADTVNNRIRRVDAQTQVITTYAGTGNPGISNDGGPATSAEITGPTGLALDGAGNLYIADTGNNAIRRVDAISHNISTVAGILGQSGSSGNNVPATSATLNAPQALAFTPSGDLVIADTSNALIRLLTLSNGYIQTIAGTGTPGLSGDGGLATSAQLSDPSGVAVRYDGAVAVADLSNNRVRLFTMGGNITTLAGTGSGTNSAGYDGDGGSAQSAHLQGPAGVTFDAAGDLFIADSVNNCIRFVFGPQNTIETLSGNPSDDRYAGDGGPENQARMHGPDGLLFDPQGNIWLSDRFNNRVRKISGSLLTIGPYPTMKVGKISQPVEEALINAGNEPLTLHSPALQQASLDATTTTCNQSALAPSIFCNMGIEFAPQNVGPSINGSIIWNSDAPNVTPVDALYGQVLSVEPTTTALTSSANPGLLGQSITLTATVTSDDTGRTGTVIFVEGGHTWCSAVQLSPSGTAACAIPSLSLGNHDFVANYSGDNNNAASQSPVFTETVKQQAALALGVSTSPATVTSNVVLTISAADSYGTPTGTVIFYDGTTPLGTVTLDTHGNASWGTSNFGVGTHTLTAQYSGDASNVAGTSDPKTLEIDQAVTTTVLSSANNNATVGSNVTLSANVVSNNGPAPTGTVQFFDGTTNLGTGPLATNGTASITINTLAPGTHAVTAIYSGDTDSATSTSASISQVIQQIGTAITLGADVDPLSAGATLHLTAIVALPPGTVADGPLSGIVSFTDSGIVLGSALINDTGQATLGVSSLSVGSHSILATFSGNTNYAPSTSTTLSEAVQKTATAIVLGSASSTTLMGKPAAFTATVSSATGIPTGSISFTDGATVLGTSPLNANGLATYTTTALQAGNHTITAVYHGDANYLTSTSAGLQQTVNLAQTSLTLSGPTSAVDAGTTTQFQAMLATPGLIPAGTLTLLDGTAVVGTDAVTAAGTFNFATSALSVGVHHLVASYSGDPNNAAAASATIVVTVQKANTITALVPDANPLTQGNPLIVTATVTSDSPNQTNNISFFDGSVLLGTVPLTANGTALLSLPGLSLGSHSLTATYAGDTNHAASTSAPVPELVVQSSSVSVTSSVNPSVSGQNVTFAAQVQGSPTPTGTMLFRDNGSALATVPLNANGLAMFATNSLSVGVHSITMTYSGDNHFATVSGNLTQTVLNAGTATTLTASADPATYKQPLSLASRVNSNGGTATGTVNFTDAGVPIGTAQLDGTGLAVLTLSTLSPATHNLVANYLGDGKASPSSSNPLTVVVKQTTTLALSSDANPTQTLNSVHLTAALTNAGAVPATGTVTFTDGATTLGVATLDSTGDATLKVPQLSAGTHTLLATYAGDGADFPSQTTGFSEVVQLRPTTTTVTETSTDATNPQQITLIAVVHGTGSVAPSGTVNFMSGAVTLGAAQVDATGVATITIIFDTAMQQVVASYIGDASYSSSQSASTKITAGTPAQFTIALSAPSITLASHQHTTLSVNIASVKGFTDTISLGCLGLPYAATCNFNSSQLKLAPDGSVTASLIIDTGDPLGAGTSSSASLRNGGSAFLCLLPAAFVLGGFRRRARRKGLQPFVAVLFSLALVYGTSGCSGLQITGTAPGTYSFKVIGTGQGSNITEAQAVTMVVTQ